MVKCWICGIQLSNDWTAIECKPCYKKLYGIERTVNYNKEDTERYGLR